MDRERHPREELTATPTRLIAELTSRFAGLAGNGEIPGLQVLRPSLEDVYLSMIKGKDSSEIKSGGSLR